RRSRSASRPRAFSARTSKTVQRGPGPYAAPARVHVPGGRTVRAACPGSVDGAVLNQVVEVERAQRFGHVAFPGVDGVSEQRGDLRNVPPGLDRVSLGGFGRRDGAQQLPEELHVEVAHRPAYG